MTECEWEIIGDRIRCKVCKKETKYLGVFPRSTCGNQSVCKHLGSVIELGGTTVRVKCGCTKRPAREQFHASYRCDVHERCLPTLRPTGEQHAEWLARKPESDLYHLCDGCEDFDPKLGY